MMLTSSSQECWNITGVGSLKLISGNIVVKKRVSKKKVAAKKVVARTAPNVKAIATRQTKTQILADIAEETELDKKQIASVFAAIGRKIEAHVKPRGSGE